MVKVKVKGKEKKSAPPPPSPLPKQSHTIVTAIVEEAYDIEDDEDYELEMDERLNLFRFAVRSVNRYIGLVKYLDHWGESFTAYGAKIFPLIENAKGLSELKHFVFEWFKTYSEFFDEYLLVKFGAITVPYDREQHVDYIVARNVNGTGEAFPHQSQFKEFTSCSFHGYRDLCDLISLVSPKTTDKWEAFLCSVDESSIENLLDDCGTLACGQLDSFLACLRGNKHVASCTSHDFIKTHKREASEEFISYTLVSEDPAVEGQTHRLTKLDLPEREFRTETLILRGVSGKGKAKFSIPIEDKITAEPSTETPNAELVSRPRSIFIQTDNLPNDVNPVRDQAVWAGEPVVKLLITNEPLVDKKADEVGQQIEELQEMSLNSPATSTSSAADISKTRRSAAKSSKMSPITEEQHMDVESDDDPLKTPTRSRHDSGNSSSRPSSNRTSGSKGTRGGNKQRVESSEEESDDESGRPSSNRSSGSKGTRGGSKKLVESSEEESDDQLADALQLTLRSGDHLVTLTESSSSESEDDDDEDDDFTSFDVVADGHTDLKIKFPCDEVKALKEIVMLKMHVKLSDQEIRAEIFSAIMMRMNEHLRLVSVVASAASRHKDGYIDWFAEAKIIKKQVRATMNFAPSGKAQGLNKQTDEQILRNNRLNKTANRVIFGVFRLIVNTYILLVQNPQFKPQVIESEGYFLERVPSGEDGEEISGDEATLEWLKDELVKCPVANVLLMQKALTLLKEDANNLPDSLAQAEAVLAKKENKQAAKKDKPARYSASGSEVANSFSKGNRKRKGTGKGKDGAKAVKTSELATPSDSIIIMPDTHSQPASTTSSSQPASTTSSSQDQAVELIRQDLEKERTAAIADRAAAKHEREMAEQVKRDMDKAMKSQAELLKKQTENAVALLKEQYKPTVSVPNPPASASPSIDFGSDDGSVKENAADLEKIKLREVIEGLQREIEQYRKSGTTPTKAPRSAVNPEVFAAVEVIKRIASPDLRTKDIDFCWFLNMFLDTAMGKTCSHLTTVLMVIDKDDWDECLVDARAILVDSGVLSGSEEAGFTEVERSGDYSKSCCVMALFAQSGLEHTLIKEILFPLLHQVFGGGLLGQELTYASGKYKFVLVKGRRFLDHKIKGEPFSFFHTTEYHEYYSSEEVEKRAKAMEV